MKRRALVLAMVLVSLGVGVTAFSGTVAAGAPNCADVGYEGSGTSDDPYQVGNVSQLQCIEEQGLDRYYELTSDIDASGTSSWQDGDGFDPIANDSEFTGTFDGDGHTVSGLTIARSAANETALFGRVGGDGTVENLTLADADITGQNQVGTVVGNNTGGTVRLVSASGTVSGENDAGGLVGRNSGTVNRSNASVAVESSGGSVGGLVGGNIAGSVTQSYATGDAGTPSATSVGGLVGLSTAGTVNESYATGNVTGDSYVGGLVGDVRTEAGSTSVVERSYATGTVTGNTNVGGVVGGMVGTFSGATSDLRESYFDELSTNQSSAVGFASFGTTVENNQGFNTSDGAGRATEMTGVDAPDNMTALAFPGTWTVRADGYPTLAWQTVSEIQEPAFFEVNITDTNAPVTEGETLTVTANVTNTGDVQDTQTVTLNDTGFENAQRDAVDVTLTGGASNESVVLEWTTSDGDTGSGDVTVASDNDTDTETISVEEILYAGGDGTESDPYEIANWHHLNNTRENLGANYTVVNDLNETTKGYDEVANETANGGDGFVPIGTGAESFTGTLDGANHTISNLTVNRSGEDTVGLFGVVGDTGTVENVPLKDTNVSGNNDVGALVGENVGTVSESSATGTVSGSERVGGLVGVNDLGTVRESSATGTVSGSARVGGLVGFNDFGTVSTSYATGTVSGSARVGGLVGFNYLGTVTDSYWDTESTGQDGSAGGGTGLTTANMTGVNATASMDGFAFTDTWHATDGYPALAWEDTDSLYGVNVTATNAPVTEGDTLNVTVNVTNWAADGEQTVTLADVDGNQQDSTTLALDSGDSTEERLAWPTADGDAGTGSVTVATANNTATQSVTVQESASFEVNITGTNAPVTAGDTLNVTVNVTKTGDTDATQTITLTDTGFSGTEQDAVDVTLTGGESNASVVLEWTTSAGDAGTGDVTIASENDTDTETVTVQEPASFAVNVTNTNAPVVEGDTLSVTANVTNTGDVQDTQTVTLNDTGFNGTGQDAVDVTLAGGASNASVTLKWATSSGDAGSGDVTVASKNDTDSASVTVQDPASFAVEIVDTTSPVVEGETLEVTANVTNTGDVQDTQTVTLEDTGFGGAEQDAVDVTLAGGASNASVVLEWTTADGDAGTGDVTVASDNDTESRSVTVEEARANFSVSIDNTSAPVVEGDTLSVNATVENVGDATGARDVNLTDFDGAEVDTQSVSLAAGEKTTVTLNWSTSTGDAGAGNVTVASDNDSASGNVTVNAPALFAVTIDGVNASVTEGEDIVVEYTVENTGGVSDTQDVVFRVNGTQNGTESGVTLNAGGTFSDSFVYTTGDSDVPAIRVNASSDDDGAERTVTVNGVLTAQDDSYTVDEDGSLSVSESNGTLDNDTDPDGDSLSASLDSDVSNGTLTLHDNGSFEYVPDSDFNGEDSFTYKADDGAGGTDTATVTITVNAINDAPTANDLSVTTDEDTAVSGTFDASDPDNSSLSYSIASAPSNGTVSISGDGFIYAPDSDYAGSDSFTYEVSDDDGATDTATVTITVNAINDAPIAANDSYTVDEDATLSVSESNGTLANDTDPEGDSLLASVVSGPSNGSLTLYANGSLTYTPDDGFTGTDSFTYEITDGNGGSDTATVTFNVTATATSQLDQDEYALQSDSGQSITGTSTKAAGSEVTVRIESQDPNNPFVDRQTVSVESDGTFSAEFDVSILPEGTTLTVRLFNSDGDEIDTATAQIAQPASFEVSNLDAPATAQVGDTVTVTADITNTGDVEGSTDAQFVLAGDVVTDFTQTLTIAGGETQTVTFELPVEDIDPGTYTHGVQVDGDADSRVTADITIEEQSTTQPPEITSAPANATVEEESSTTLSVSATDPEGESLAYDWNLSGAGVLNATSGTTVRYDAPADVDANDTATLTVAVDDGTTTVTTNATIAIVRVNDPPTTANDSYAVTAGTTLSVSATNGTLANDTDPDGDALTVSTPAETEPENGTLTLNANGSLTYTPDDGFTGTDSFTYEASDGSGDADTASVTITVSAVNDAPEITSGPANATLDEENSTVLSVTATDDDTTDTLSYNWTLTGNGSLNTTSGTTVRYDAPDELTSEDTATVTVTVNDSTTEVTATATVTVNPVNDAPTITSAPANTTVDDENSTVLSVTAADNDTTDTLSYDWSLSGNGSLNATTGTSIRYDAPEELAANETATVTVAVNGSTASATATATITIVAVNDAPTTANDSYTVPEDGTLSVLAANGTLANDTDPDGDVLNASVVSGPSNGSLTLYANGSFEYTPAPDFNGEDSFTYQASDGAGGTDTATVTITVSPVNDAPEITSAPANATVDEGNSTFFSMSATDNDTGDSLSYTWTLTGNGSLNTTSGTTVRYDAPDELGASQAATVRVDASDGTTNATATATVTINPVNGAPEIKSAPANTTVDEENSAVLSVNATDADGDELAYDWNLSGAGVLNATSSPVVSYEAPEELAVNQTATVTVTIDDGSTTVSTTATITIVAVNDAPEITAPPADTTVDEGNATVLSVDATDADGDVLSYAWNLSGTGSLNETSGTAVRYDAPNDIDATTDVTVTVTVDDGKEPDSATAIVTVEPVNEPPTAENDSYSVDEGTTLAVSAANGTLANDADPDGDSPSASVVSGPSNGTLTLHANGSFAYMPDADFTGNDSFTYEASDGNGGSDTTTVTITVTGSQPTPANFTVVITDTNAPVVEGETLTVTANITNTGDVEATQTVTLTDSGFDGIERDTVNVTLAGGESNASVEFEWVTSEGDAGSGDITVASENETSIESVTVQEPASFAVNVTGTNEPVIEGETLSVTANVTNTGDVQETQTVTLTDTGFGDVEQDAVNVTLAGGESNASAVLEWTTTEGDAGTGDLTVATQNDSTTESVTIEPANTDDPPTATDDSYAVSENEMLTVSVPGVLNNDSDPDGDALTVSTPAGTEPENGTLTLNADGSFEYTPDDGFTGTDSFTYEVTDGNGGSDTATVTINVTATATPQFAVSITNTNAPVTEGDTLTASVTVDNVGGAAGTQTITLEAFDSSQVDSQSVSLNPDETATITLEWATQVGDVGSGDLTVASENDTATRSATVDAADTNDPPVASDDSYTTPENETLAVSVPGVLDNDSDPDGDSLTVTVLNAPSNGGLDLRADGSFEYTPDAGFTGEDSFTYEATDGNGDTDTATVTITVEETATATSALSGLSIAGQGPSATITEGDDENVAVTVENTGEQSGAFTITLDIGSGTVIKSATTAELAADETDTVTFENVTGSLSPGEYEVDVTTPDDELTGTLSISQELEPATFDVTIDTIPDTVTAGEELVVEYTVENTGDETATQDIVFQINGSQTAVDDTVQLSGGESSTGQFAYRTDESDVPTVEVTVLSDDDAATTGVSVDTTETNSPPEASNDNYAVFENETLPVNAPGILANDSEPDGDDLTVSIPATTPPDNGNLSLNANGSFAYTPDNGFTGEDTFAYEVTDGNGGSDTATVTITVTEGAAPAEPALSDLSIAGQGTSATITEGDDENVAVTVENVGETGSTFTVTLNIGNGTVTESATTAELAADETDTVTFEGVTSGLAPGEYDVAVTADDANRTGALTISEASDPPEPDSAEFETTITDVNDSVVAGDTVTVAYTVENVGDETGTQDVTFTVNGTVETTVADIALDGSESTTGTVTYETNASDTPTISVAIESDDDTATETVTVQGVPELTIGEFDDEFPNATEGTNYGTVAIPVAETAGVESTNLSVQLVIAGEDGSELINETIADRELANESATFDFDVGTIDAPDEYTATVSVDAETAGSVSARHVFAVAADDSNDGGGGSGGDDDSSGSDDSSDDESELEIDQRDDGSAERLMLTVQNPADGEQFETDLAAENRTLATDTVTIDALRFNASSQQDLELTLTTTSTPTETTPNQTVPAQSDVTLGYLSAENGSAVENVSFEFTLDEEALSERNAPPETVVFHRYNETTETWVAKNTTLQNRSNGELRYETVVESFSEWALTADRPEITVTDAQLETRTAQPGESVAVDVTVTNDGHASGNETVELLADGQVVTSETVSLDGEETQQITLTTTFDDVGEYDVAVEGTDSGIVTIQSETTTPSEPRTPTDGTDESTDTSDPDTDTGPSDGDGSGFRWWTVGAVVVIGALIAAAVLRYREGGTED